MTRWSETKEHLEELPDENGKIKYLLEVMAKAKQSKIPDTQMEAVLLDLGRDIQQLSSARPLYDDAAAFYRKCEIELEKLRAQAALDKISEPKTTQAFREFTLARQVLAFKYIFEALGVTSASREDKAKLIHFLTSKDPDNIRKELSRRRDDDRLGEDTKFLKSYFLRLGADKIVELIDKNSS